MKHKSADSIANDNIRRSDLSVQTMSALFWVFSGSSFQYVLRTIILIILARLLLPTDFGIVAAALTVAQFTEIFALLGVGPAIVQRQDLNDTHLRTGFTCSIVFGMLLAALIWFLAPEIASFFNNDEVTFVLRVIILVFPLSGFTVVAESLIQRNLQFRKLVGVEVVSYTISYGILGISLALIGYGVWSLVTAYIAQEIIKASAILVVQPHPKRLQFDVKAFKELFNFGAGLTLTNIFNYFATQGDNLVVGRWLGMEALGLYGRAFNLMRIPVSIIGTVLGKVLFPVMSKLQDEPERLVIAYRRGTALVGLIILPLSLISYLLAPELIDVLLGPTWRGVVAPFQILVIGMLFRTSYIISASLTRAKGAVYRNAWRQVVYAVLVIGGAWIGQHWGLSGVAIGVLIALIVHFLLMAQLGLSMISFTWRQLGSIHLPAIWFSMIIGIVVWGIAVILRDFNVASLLTLMTCVICALLTSVLLIRLIPFHILGRDGVWLIQTLIERLPNNFLFFHWLKHEIKSMVRL